MAQEGADEEKSKSSSRYTVVFQSQNNNDLRVTCNNDKAIKTIANWYQKQTKEIAKPQKSKFTKAMILDCARKDKNFGTYDWENIIMDYMLANGYELFGAPVAVKMTTGDYPRQEIKLIFISPVVSSSNPPTYTMQ
eukprot:862935_1